MHRSPMAPSRSLRAVVGAALAGLAACGPPAPTVTPLVTAHATALAQAQAVDAAEASNTAALVEGLGACPPLETPLRSELEHALSQVGLPQPAEAPPAVVEAPTACLSALGAAAPAPPWMAGLSAAACTWAEQCTPAAAALLVAPKDGERGPLSPLSAGTAPLSSLPVALDRHVDDVARVALLQAASKGAQAVAETAVVLHRASHAHRRDAGPDQLAVARKLEERALVRISALLLRGALTSTQARQLSAQLAPASPRATDWHTLLRIGFLEQNRHLAAGDPQLLDQLRALPGRSPTTAPPAADATPLDLAWVNNAWLPAWRELLEAPPYGPRERRPLYTEAEASAGTTPRLEGSPFAELRERDLALLALDSATCSTKLALVLATLPPAQRRADPQSPELQELLGKDCSREPVLHSPWKLEDLGNTVSLGGAVTDFDRARRLGLGDDLRQLIERRLPDTLRL